MIEQKNYGLLIIKKLGCQKISYKYMTFIFLFSVQFQVQNEPLIMSHVYYSNLLKEIQTNTYS